MERSIYQAELRAEPGAEGAPPVIAGYAAVFNQPSLVLYGMFREKIAPGAFSESLGVDDIRVLWNHNDDYVLGRNRNNTLSLNEDSYGLNIRNEPPNTSWGRDAVVSIGRRDVDQMSFMFDTLVDDWTEERETGQIMRTLYKLRLYEVSPVTFPAYPQTSVGVRGIGRTTKPQPFQLAVEWRDKIEQALPTMPGWVQARLADGAGEAGRALSLRRRRLALYKV